MTEARRTTLCVASGGGHLRQLLILRERIDPPLADAVWVTYGNPSSASMLQGSDVVRAYGPSTRNLPNAYRNWRLSADVVDPSRVSRVVSTGAGIAVPFIVRARARGISAHYIESATRVDGPSLTGRILERVPGVSLHTQHGWERNGWAQIGSVFDSFSLRHGPPRRPRHILVALGTHRAYRFDALVARAQSLIRDDDEVTWQLGATPGAGLPGAVEDELPAQRFEFLLRNVDVIVAHAGTGVALSALLEGKSPVLIPRRAARGEHVDDHQVAIARELDRRGLALYREVDRLTRSDLEVAAGRRIERAIPPPIRLGDK